MALPNPDKDSPSVGTRTDSCPYPLVLNKAPRIRQLIAEGTYYEIYEEQWTASTGRSADAGSVLEQRRLHHCPGTQRKPVRNAEHYLHWHRHGDCLRRGEQTR